MNILAIEVGTSAIRAAALDAATREIRGAIAVVDVAHDASSSGAEELHAAKVWQATAAASRQAVQHSGIAGQPGHDIAGIGLSAFMPGLVLLGDDDQPLMPIWTHHDRRARPAARQVWAHVGHEFHATTGNRPLPGLVSALAWRQQHGADPYLSHRVRSYMHVNGWLALHMTGAKAFDPANACCTGLFGTLTDQSWSQRWCEYFQVESAWLPEIIDGGAAVGALRSAIASELGVPAGIPVKLGASDLGTMILAARLEPGDVLHVGGKTTTLATLTTSPKPGARRLVHRLGVGPLFVHRSCSPVGTDAFAWLHQLCFRDQSPAEFYESTVPLARQRTTRVSFDPPFLAGDAMEIEAHRAACRDLELTTDRLDVLAALLEGASRRHGEAFANLNLPGPPRRAFLIGDNVEMVRRLMVDDQNVRTQPVVADPLCGVAGLFAS